MVTISLIPYKGFFLPKQRQIIFLSTSKMKKLHLQRGSPVILTCVTGELLFKCWPHEGSDAVLPASALFKHYTGLLLSIQLFKGQAFEAESIVFVPDKYQQFMHTEDFLVFLKRKLSYVYMQEGMILHFNYLGYPFSLTLYSIVSSFAENKKLDSEIKNISTTLLPSLDDSLNEKFISRTFCLQSSTPVSSPKTQLHTNPNINKDFYSIGAKTICIIQNPDSERQKSNCKINDIAGVGEEIFKIKSSIRPLLDQDLPFGTRGILITGPPGTGKSLIIDAIHNEYKYLLPLHDIKDAIFCNGIGILKKLLKKLEIETPCLILIDDIDRLLKNKDLQIDLHSMIYKILSSSLPILLIATSQSTDLIPADLRKRGFMEEEIKLAIPSTSDRLQIAEKVLQMYENNLTSDQICEASNMAHGFTGGDLKRLCHEAFLKTIEDNSSDCHITFHHLQNSFINIKPSSISEFSLEVPNVKWSDIGGMEDVKEAVKEMVDWPLKHPEKLKKFKIIPPRGILMYGPPGCCKTMVAKALASESQLNFINIKSSQVFNMYVGESEKSVSELFKKARAAAPCILFLDEVDALVPVRGSTSGSSNVTDRVVTQILVEIDGIDVLEQGVSVIAATNRPERIDPSLLRPGRLDRLIYVHLPDAKTRKEIFEVMLRKKPISSDIDLQYLVENTANYTGAEISAVCLEASKIALKEGQFIQTSPVNMKHFLTALKCVQPRTTQEMLETFKDYHRKFQFKT